MIDLEQLQRWLDSPEEAENRKKFMENWNWNHGYYTMDDEYIPAGKHQRIIEWFHNKSESEQNNLIEYLVNYYNSDEYYKSFYSKGYEPTTDLFWALLDYAILYGKPMDIPSQEHFPEELYLINNLWIIRLMIGQGSVVDVWKKEEEV